MSKGVLKDFYELLYESSRIVRIMSRVGLWILGRISSQVREKIKENIEISSESPLQIADGNSIPFSKMVIEISNSNYSSLRIDALNISLSLSRRNSVFKTFYWDRNSISNPPRNIQLNKVAGKDDTHIFIEFMLPYFLHFPNDDVRIYVDGTIKFDSDAGPVEQEFESRIRLERETLWNRTTAQDDLVRNFSPSELAIEKERESE